MCLWSGQWDESKDSVCNFQNMSSQMVVSFFFFFSTARKNGNMMAGTKANILGHEVNPSHCEWPSCSVAKSCPTFCNPMDCSTPSFPVLTISQSLFKCMSTESVMPSNHLILCRPLLLLPSIFLIIRVFSSESALHIRWSMYWSFSFSISPSSEYSGLISFRIDWFHLLAVQGILNSLLQHHRLKPSILWCSAFFMVQLSHPYVTTRITMALTIQTFVGKVMSLFNMLSRWMMTEW